MIDKYGFDSLESFLFVSKLQKCINCTEDVSAARGALEVPGSSYSVEALCAKQAFVVFLLFLSPLEIQISL